VRVALVVHCYYPRHFHGTEAYVASLANGLPALGHEPIVITATPEGDPPQGELVERRKWQGVEVISIDRNALPSRGVRDTYDFPALGSVAAEVLREARPDVVHVCHLINHTTAMLHAARALDLPILATLTDFFGFCYTNQLQSAEGAPCPGPTPTRDNCLSCYLKATAAAPGAPLGFRLAASSPQVRRTAARLIAGANALRRGSLAIGGFRPSEITERPDILSDAAKLYALAIAPTQSLKDAYEAQGFPAPMRLGRIGVDIDRSIKPPRSDPILRLGYIGQIAPHKGLDVLLRAMRLVGNREIALQVWGLMRDDDPYCDEARRLAAGGAVAFEGVFAAEKTAEVLAGLDLLVVPSVWRENGPVIVLQALATHTPVIASDQPGLTEVVRDGENGMVFPSGDPNALAAAIDRIAGDRRLLAKLSTGADYPRDQRAMVEEMASCYEEARELHQTARPKSVRLGE
jgi:glycosyltransferase involved in cell wall biosynthesis